MPWHPNVPYNDIIEQTRSFVAQLAAEVEGLNAPVVAERLRRVIVRLCETAAFEASDQMLFQFTRLQERAGDAAAGVPRAARGGKSPQRRRARPKPDDDDDGSLLPGEGAP